MHPILFRFGPITLYSYGLMVALGFITATLLAARTAPKFGIAPDRINTLSLIILISGIIGARALYILLNLKDFISDPVEIFMISHGGLVFYGGAVVSFLSGAAYSKISKMPVLDTADLIAPYIALGHSIGRIGCFLNGCCFGKPAAIFLGVAFGDGVIRYPTQIYSSVCLLLLYMFLRVCLEFRQFRGQIFFLYIIFYSAGRFYIEFLRGDSPIVAFNLTVFQLISLALLLFGILGYWGMRARWNRTK